MVDETMSTRSSKRTCQSIVGKTLYAQVDGYQYNAIVVNNTTACYKLWITRNGEAECTAILSHVAEDYFEQDELRSMGVLSATLMSEIERQYRGDLDRYSEQYNNQEANYECYN
jgi:hypothetical protein